MGNNWVVQDHYALGSRKRTLMSWDEWMRRRCRMYIWKQWKKPRTKVVNLRKLGIPADKAYQWGQLQTGILAYRRESGASTFHYKRKTLSSGIL